MKKPEELRGMVTKVDRAAVEYPGPHLGTKRTFHVSTFQVGQRRVKFEAARPLTVNEGDQVAVTGVMRGNTLDALAYRNFTTGVSANTGLYLWFLVGVIFTGVGIAVLSVPFLSTPKGIAGYVGVAIFGGGMFLFASLGLYFGVCTLRAVLALRAEVPQKPKLA